MAPFGDRSISAGAVLPTPPLQSPACHTRRSTKGRRPRMDGDRWIGLHNCSHMAEVYSHKYAKLKIHIFTVQLWLLEIITSATVGYKTSFFSDLQALYTVTHCAPHVQGYRRFRVGCKRWDLGNSHESYLGQWNPSRCQHFVCWVASNSSAPNDCHMHCWFPKFCKEPYND